MLKKSKTIAVILCMFSVSPTLLAGEQARPTAEKVIDEKLIKDVAQKVQSGQFMLVENLPAIVKRVVGGVVNISSTTIVNYQSLGMDDFFGLYGIPRESKQVSLGSGVIIDNEGYVVTNAHVVKNASEVIITLNDKRSLRARIIGKDDKMDLAVLQLRDEQNRPCNGLQADELGDSDAVELGETVIAIGNPFGLQHTVTKGIISAKNRSIGLGPFDNFLQTDASINPGNSGGPLFNREGKVIGINTAIRSETGQSSGLGFAIPSKEVKAVIPDLKRYGYVPRPWLGVLPTVLSRQLAAFYQVPFREGVYVLNIVEPSPAFSRIEQGDIIIQVGSEKVSDALTLEKALNQYHSKETVSIRVVRRNQRTGRFEEKDLSILLEAAPRGKWVLPQGVI